MASRAASAARPRTGSHAPLLASACFGSQRDHAGTPSSLVAPPHQTVRAPDAPAPNRLLPTRTIHVSLLSRRPSGRRSPHGLLCGGAARERHSSRPAVAPLLQPPRRPPHRQQRRRAPPMGRISARRTPCRRRAANGLRPSTRSLQRCHLDARCGPTDLRSTSSCGGGHATVRTGGRASRIRTSRQASRPLQATSTRSVSSPLVVSSAASSLPVSTVRPLISSLLSFFDSPLLSCEWRSQR